MRKSDVQEEDARSVLGEPIIEDFSENTLKIRRNLIVVSFIVLFFKLGDVQIDFAESTIFGLRFSNIDSKDITYGLFFLTFYLLAHFIWSGLDTVREWRLRLAATWKKPAIERLGYMDAHIDHDSPNDPINSNPYKWFYTYRNELAMILQTYKKLDEELKNHNRTSNDLIEAVRRAVKELDRKSLHRRRSEMEIRLERYDKGLRCYNLSRSLMFFIIELTLPALMGAWAVGLLLLA